MATLAQIGAKSSSALTTLEKDHVREVLGLSSEPGTTEFTDLETLLDGLAAVRNQKVRAVLDDWDAIIPEPSKKSGGAQGIEYETGRHRYQVYADMSRALGRVPATYAVWLADSTATATFGILRVRVPDCATDDWCDA